MEETYFITSERLKKELDFFRKEKKFLTKPNKKLESLENVYIFQPAFIEVIETIAEKMSTLEIKKFISDLEEFINKSPYNIEEKDTLLWALELWKVSPDLSFLKMLNAAKARKNRIHSVLK